MATKNYSQFNSLTVTGRIYHAEVVTKADGTQFMGVSVISTATTDGASIIYKFTNSNGLMSLHNKGYFCKGREVTITGHIANVSEVYTDQKTGEVKLRQNPEISLIGVMVPEGGMGRMPMADNPSSRPVAGTVIKMSAKPELDETPELSKEEAQAVAF